MQRMHYFRDVSSWRRHISQCIPDYVKSLPSNGSIPCPHPLCTAVLHSELVLWHHLGDVHSTPKPDVGMKRKDRSDGGQDEEAETSGAVEKRPRLRNKLSACRRSALKNCSEDPVGPKFIYFRPVDPDPSPAVVIKTASVSSMSPSHCSNTLDTTWTEDKDTCASTSPSSASSEIPIDPLIHPGAPAPDFYNTKTVDLTGIGDPSERGGSIATLTESAYLG